MLQPDPKWEFPRERMRIEQVLGEGEFGRVLRASARDLPGLQGESPSQGQTQFTFVVESDVILWIDHFFLRDMIWAISYYWGYQS